MMNSILLGLDSLALMLSQFGAAYPWVLPLYGVAVLQVLLIVGSLFLPITFERDLSGRNASNNPFWIVLAKGLIYRAAIWAQEFYEYRCKINLIFVFILIATKAAGITVFQRRLEISGHEVEVQAAVELYDEDEETYRQNEAYGMSQHYDAFKGMSVPEIEQLMKAQSTKAKRFVRCHGKRIRKQMKST